MSSHILLYFRTDFFNILRLETTIRQKQARFMEVIFHGQIPIVTCVNWDGNL